jgi:hypothetical protein
MNGIPLFIQRKEKCSAACDMCKANKPVKQNKELQVEKDSYKMLD